MRYYWQEIKENPRQLTDAEAFDLIDDVIDTLIEVGNGTTDEMLHASADKLFAVRDYYIKGGAHTDQKQTVHCGWCASAICGEGCNLDCSNRGVVPTADIYAFISERRSEDGYRGND